MTDKIEKPLWGARAIAEFIGRTERQAFRLLEEGHIPAQKIGNAWVADKGRLRQVLGGGRITKKEEEVCDA